MTTTSSKIRPPLNGVDTPTLFATLDAVRANPGLATFQFRATNEWISGTHNRSAIRGFYGAGQEDSTRTADFTYDADHPAVLVGTGNGPTPVEFLLHAIAACLTAGIANVAAVGVCAARGQLFVEGESTCWASGSRPGAHATRQRVRSRSRSRPGRGPARLVEHRGPLGRYDVPPRVPVSIDVTTG